MIIVGLDLSPKSPGCFKYTLDDDMKPIDFDHLGFTDVKKNEKDKIHFYHKKNTFNNYIDREHWMLEHITKFCEGADYVSIEDYAFAAKGRVFHIAEFAGLVKYNLYRNNMKLRLYDPGSIKLFATTRGNCDKISMYEAFQESGNMKFDLKGLPVVNRPSGKSPTSDLVDAYYCANLLLVELTIREGLKTVKDYGKDVIQVFNRVTVAHPTNILSQDFICLEL
jgi:hypothetical protein